VRRVPLVSLLRTAFPPTYSMDFMAPDLSFIAAVDRLYAGLVLCAEADSGLGGKLLYAGELDAEGRALMVAANIAGAASLAATADPAAQKLAIRDGIADFLVTSLDEALRILKNEIRKRQTVAVCVALAPKAVEQEMLERGVLPDLLPPGAPAFAAFLRQGARPVVPADPTQNQTVLTWSVAASPALWLPRLDDLVLDCLSPAASGARRWLRLAPRYLGRLAQGVRLLRCDKETAVRFRELAQHAGAPSLVIETWESKDPL
jgi:hypothetical protein